MLVWKTLEKLFSFAVIGFAISGVAAGQVAGPDWETAVWIPMCRLTKTLRPRPRYHPSIVPRCGERHRQRNH